MSSDPEEWPFLEDGWRYALVLTGKETEAGALVGRVLNEMAGRRDATDPGRARRVFFSALFRAARQTVPSQVAETPAEQAVAALHRLPEPGRSAWALLLLGHFSGDHLAGLVGLGERELADALTDVRRRLEAAAT
ncbi:MAG: hypothetical protein SFU53_03050 [Terrimicrobiaceae bacterium]|nr:hypothetical protein [Terrimicrobiaceae bacterium]